MNAFLIDADGVALKKHEYFSSRLARELNLPLNEVLPFFIEEFPRCSLGEADLREVVAPWLVRWGWQGSVDDLLAYWFAAEDEPDQAVLEAVARLRESGVRCYLATDQERYRAEHIKASIGNQFDGAFFSCDLGLKKSDPAFFARVLELLGLEARTVGYLDDDPKNVAVGEMAGLVSRLYASEADLSFLRG